MIEHPSSGMRGLMQLPSGGGAGAVAPALRAGLGLAEPPEPEEASSSPSPLPGATACSPPSSAHPAAAGQVAPGPRCADARRPRQPVVPG